MPGHTRTLPPVKTVLVALAGAALSVLAFPPFGPGALIVPGTALFLLALHRASGPREGLLAGLSFGLAFFGGLMWWLSQLELIALVLVPVQALFFAGYGWWIARWNDRKPLHWVSMAVGSWAVFELVRYRFPVGGQEWGAAGYALSDNLVTRLPAALVGTSGLTVLVVLVGAEIAAAVFARSWRWGAAAFGTVVLLLVPALMLGSSSLDGSEVPVAIVQGSTPCPFEHCPPDERLRTFQQHLALTDTIDPGSVDLVVWPESSTGSTNADPVLNQEIREAIGAQARRIGAPLLIGGDRVVSESEFINANVVFDETGDIVGEYRKQHAVPFGEYIPLRPLFEWIPALDRVPRDMVPGDGPVVFAFPVFDLGSVISWEGGFSRYSLEHRRLGADLMVVATNKSSYGPVAPTSDQFIGMTRMRAVELGVPVVHAAVTGKSTVIDARGSFSETTRTGESVVFYGVAGPSTTTPYVRIGDLVMWLAAVGGLIVWAYPLVGSRRPNSQED